MLITSRENETIKNIIKLKEKKFRKERFVIEGIKMLKEAINENANIELIVVSEDANFISGIDKIDFDISKYKNIEVPEKIFRELTDVETPQGVLAVISKNKICEEKNCKEENKNVETKMQNNTNQESKNIPQIAQKLDLNVNYILVLDGIQDPGNLGTIIRTADSANLKQIIVSKDTVDSYSPKVVRATMGAIFRVNIIEVDNLAKMLKELNKNGFETVTTSLDTNKSIYDIDYNKKVVIIGNEANGVSKDVQDISNYKVKIPMLGKTESLNASVATGIMIYEYIRQSIKK